MKGPKPKNHGTPACSGFEIFSLIIPAMLTIVLVVIYTIILQNNFSDETLRAGLEMNTACADSTYSTVIGEFSADEMLGYNSVEDMQSGSYQRLQNRLDALRRNKFIRYLYTAARDDDGTFIYVVDGLSQKAEDFACPGTPIEPEMFPYLETALSGKTVYSSDILDTTWGYIYTACYPIMDENGQVAGALCMEISMDSIYASISAGNQRVFILTIAAVVIVIMMSVPVHIIMQRQSEKEDRYNQELHDSLKRVREREMILEALSIDFDSVYLCDLLTDRTIVIKEDASTYDPSAYELLGDNGGSYSFRMNGYFEHFVEQDSAPGFTEKLSAASLMNYLSEHSHMTYRFRVKPNPTGHVHMETKIVPVRSDEGFKIVMGFHYIDDIIEEQERSRAQLEKALNEAEKNNEIISAVAKIYQLIYYIDLVSGTYEMIAPGDDPDDNIPPTGSIEGMTDSTLAKFVGREWRSEMRTFLDISTLADRLENIDSVTAECQGDSGQWYRARYIIKNRDAQGRAIGVLYVAREITNEKKQELDLKQRLKESAEEAERANASKTDFLRRMSHDVRTPINGIRGMVEIANYYPNDLRKQKECRDKIWDSTGHLLSLVNNILDMNKLESGRITLRHEQFDLLKLISEIENISEMQAVEHNVRFLNETDERSIEHRKLKGSETHLRQILLNFTSNSVKYNHEGGSVTLRCRELSSDGQRAVFRFTCEDTGIGMSEEFQKCAFEPFSQEEQGCVNTNYAGSGLGLSIAKQLIELMGGSVDLESKPGVGTKIGFTLAFDIDGDPHDDSGEALSGIRLDGVNALLAEDNDLNAEIAEFLLEKYGISVTRAENGQRAVKLFESSEPGEYDVIFMDVMMPVMGGLDAARKIRSLDRPDAASIPIFAMTANAFTDDIQRSFDAGMNEHLTKPLQESEIIRALHKYLNERLRNSLV